MSFPKFTAEAALENYGLSTRNHSEITNYDNSIKIEPAIYSECYMELNCRSAHRRYKCGSRPGGGVEWCEGVEPQCERACFIFNDDGIFLRAETKWYFPSDPDWGPFSPQ
jgi:hypothetical protein